MSYLAKNYKKLNINGRESIDYKDPATRFAYVYKYVAAHGDYLVQILQLLRGRYAKIFESERIRVSCAGGGPGSDIIGILKYLDENKDDEPVKRITCYLLDKEQAWADTWTELGESLQAHVALNVNFQPLDVTQPESWSAQRKFLNADIFTMSYFLSEVFHLDDDGGTVTNFWKVLFKDAKQGALFIYVDNGHTDFHTYFDKQWESAGLKCLTREDNKTLTPRFSEQASELGIYRKKFDQQPKLRSVISYRVLRKVLK
jgi:hypothetical protein